MSALIHVFLSAESVQLQPGQESEITVTVQNRSEIVDNYAITLDGLDPSWVSLSRSEVSLFPKDQDQVRLTLRVPGGSGARAGLRQIQLQATSRDNPAERTVIPLSLEVLPVSSFEAVLRPQRQAGMLQGDYRLFLSNAGNADLNVQLTATDPEEGCLFTFDPPRPLLSPGQESIVSVRVRPKLPPREQAVSYPFVITVRPQEAPKAVRQVSGEFVQTPPDLALTLQPPRARGTREGLFTVQVANQGSAPVKVQLQAADLEQQGLFLFEPSVLEVPAAGQATARLRARFRSPPLGTTPRTARFVVTAGMAEAPAISCQVQGEWEQLPASFELAIQPGQQGGASGLFVVLLRNTSDADLTLSLTASDPQQAGLYSLAPARAVVPAGQTRTVGLTVQPNPAVRRQAGAFTLTAQADEFPGLLRQVQGQWQLGSAPAATPAAAGAPRPHFWATLAVLLVGGLISLGVALGLAIIADSTVVFFVSWAATMVGVVFVARAVWNGPRFWPFLIVLVVVWIVATALGYLLAISLEDLGGDAGAWPLAILGSAWLGGFIGGVVLSRRVAMRK